MGEKHQIPGYGTSYNISNFRSASVVFDGYPETLTPTDNTHKHTVWEKTILKKKEFISKEYCQ